MYVQFDTQKDCQDYIDRLEAVTLNFCRQYFPQRIGNVNGSDVLLSIENETWDVQPDATPTKQWDFPRLTPSGKYAARKPTQEQVGQVPIALYDAVIGEGVEVEYLV